MTIQLVRKPPVGKKWDSLRIVLEGNHTLKQKIAMLLEAKFTLEHDQNIHFAGMINLYMPLVDQYGHPLTHFADLRIPLMVVTGHNDPRVPESEANQMVAAVRAAGRPAWHLIGQNEGHGFAKKENQDYQFWVNLMFWQANLLGGAQG